MKKGALKKGDGGLRRGMQTGLRRGDGAMTMILLLLYKSHVSKLQECRIVSIINIRY